MLLTKEDTGLMYLDNASAGIMSKNTLDSIFQYLKFEAANGTRLAYKKFDKEIQCFYENVKTLINADSVDEIAFLDSSSRAINLIINPYNIHQGDKILTLSSEFGTTLLALINCANRVGAKLEVLKCQLDGTFSMESLEDYLKTGIDWVVISHVAAQGSILNPVKEVGELVAKYKSKYIVDGCQAVGQVSINVKELNCDAYLASGRKWLCGPRGTGFVYINKDSKIVAPQLDVASSEFAFDNDSFKIVVTKTARRFELWERNVANMIGLSRAVANCIEFGEINIEKMLCRKANRIRYVVSENKKFEIVGNVESKLGTIGFLAKERQYEQSFRNCLENNNIQISYLKKWECPMFLKNTDLRYIFRISPHYFTSERDIDYVCNIISRF